MTVFRKFSLVDLDMLEIGDIVHIAILSTIDLSAILVNILYIIVIRKK